MVEVVVGAMVSAAGRVLKGALALGDFGDIYTWWAIVTRRPERFRTASLGAGAGWECTSEGIYNFV